VARDAVAIARDGLRARGLGEEVYLAPLEEIAESGVTQAERWLARAERGWAGDVARIFAEAEV
jgi:glutamate--cysteine ligase